MLTAHIVVDDIIALLKGSTLCANLSGEVYREGERPRNSSAEDVVVTFINGMSSQIENGTVTLNIYIADITPYANGQYVENGARTKAVEILASQWVKSLSAALTNYRFKLLRTISTYAESEIHQHRVAVQLEYYYKF